jgi:hypothetical protein
MMIAQDVKTTSVPLHTISGSDTSRPCKTTSSIDFHLEMIVFVILLLLSSVVVEGLYNCSQFSIDRDSGLPYAFQWFPPDTISNKTWEAALAYCSSLFDGNVAQLAIARKTSTVSFLFSLQADGSAALGIYSIESYIGMRQNSSGIWVWIDGVVCDPNSPSDERCSGNCQFDNSGPYAGIWSGWEDKIDDTNSGYASSLFCEIPRNFFLLAIF